jgi:energy-coupling factor transporter ATP-binding protein EcfA2
LCSKRQEQNTRENRLIAVSAKSSILPLLLRNYCRLYAPYMDDNGITYIGVTNYRNTNKRFGIKDKDRLGHIYVIGKTGVGKSTLLKSMAMQDINRGNGLCVLDPHGDIAVELVARIPESRKNDLVYFNPKGESNTVTFNPLYGVHPSYHSLVASGLISTFKKIWFDSWGPRMEHILRFSLLTLLCHPEGTLLDIQQLLTDAGFRDRALMFVEDEHILSFWKGEFEQYSKAFRSEVIAPILNKTGLFIASAPLRNTVGQKDRGVRMQEVMDKKKILICNLSKGELGEDASSLLGSIILTSIQHAALFRARQEASTRIPFYCYVDECHSFLSLSFAAILSEARKYGLSLFLAHQYIEQLDERIRSAIFGNVGTIISFRVGATDAEYLAKEFFPTFGTEDLICLHKHSIYLKLMIDGATSQPFSAVSINERTLQHDSN